VFVLFAHLSICQALFSTVKQETANNVMSYQVTIENTSESFRCTEGQHLLQGMESLGWSGIPVGCRRGGCGVCKVKVTSGSYEKRKMSRAFISQADESNNLVLACCCFPTSDLSLIAIEKMEKALVSNRSEGGSV
jgi:ferredoxin